MAVRVYFVPVIGDGSSITNARRPKYVSDGGIAGVFQCMDYGNEPTMLVAADVTLAEQTALATNPDVIVVPANLDATIGANLGAVQAALDALNIPADWITGAMTYRIVLRWIARLFLISQKFQGLAGGRIFPAGITLNSTVGDLSTSVRQKLLQGAQSLNLDTSGITLAMTIRAALKLLGNQMTLPILFAGQAL